MSETFIFGIITFILVLGPLVILHELGHLITARKFGVKVSDIKRWNNLKNDNIRENQKLIIFPKRIPKT